MELHNIHSWHVYLCPKCNLSQPPKDKYVVTVCKRKDRLWGFFINSEIPRLVLASPEMAGSQIKLTPNEYSFLRHDSYVGRHDLKEFYTWELTRHITSLDNTTKNYILGAVEKSTTIDAERIQIILSGKDND
jgi:hypothetical protein